MTEAADVVGVDKREEQEPGDMVDAGGMKFLRALADCQVTDPVVSSFLAYVSDCCTTHNLLSPINFPLDHPVEEVTRSTVAFISTPADDTSQLSSDSNVCWK